jgi:hypothetical protein
MLMRLALAKPGGEKKSKQKTSQLVSFDAPSTAKSRMRD